MIPSFRSVFFPEKQEIHYIGGTDILPLPLSSEEEGHAISLLGGGQDEEGKKLLIEHNLRLVVYIAKKFDNTGVGVEDLISIGTIGLIKAINTFNPETVIVGGELAEAGDYLMLPLKSATNKYSLNLVYKDTKFRLSKMGKTASAWGAAMLIRNQVLGLC